MFLAPNLPDPHGATGARSYAHLIRQLVRRGHEIRYLVYGSPTEPSSRASVEFVNASRGAFSLRLVSAKSEGVLRRKLRSIIWPHRPPTDCPVRTAVASVAAEGYDVLHVEESGGWYGVGFERALLSVHNLQRIDRAGEHPLYGLSLWKDGIQARRAERQIIARVQHFRCLTANLADAVHQLNRHALTYVVPSALDLSDYPALPEPSGPPTIGIIGSMFWRPSRDAARRLSERIFPRVRRHIPEARLLIAGWAADRFLATETAREGTEVIPNVADAQDFFRRIHVLVYAPWRASGLKIKVAEALAFGRAVVTTEDGTEGLGLEAGRHCIVGGSDVQFADNIVGLLRDPANRQRIALAGREVIADRLSPERTTDLMEQAYAAVCQH